MQYNCVNRNTVYLLVNYYTFCMEYVRFPWPPVWQHMIVRGLQEHCIATEVIGSTKKTNLIPTIQLCPLVPTIPFELWRRRFPTKIAFAMKINQGQGQTLKSVGTYPSLPVFPMVSSTWHFSDPLHLTTSLLLLLKGVDNVQTTDL
jgi:hypothetical protein